MKVLKDSRIFIVDDDPYWRAIMEEMLKQMGYTNLYCFENGPACIEKLNLNPHLVFLDFQMEKMNGIETLQAIKSYYPHIGVFLSTSFEDLSVALYAFKFGCDDYLLKENASTKQISELINRYQNSKN